MTSRGKEALSKSVLTLKINLIFQRCLKDLIFIENWFLSLFFKLFKYVFICLNVLDFFLKFGGQGGFQEKANCL